VHDVIAVEYGQQPLHGARRVVLAGLDVFAKDAPSVLDARRSVSWSGVLMKERYSTEPEAAIHRSSRDESACSWLCNESDSTQLDQ
jgi:hypothetical protein